MAGFGTNRRLPGSENTPVHGAVDNFINTVGSVPAAIGKGVGDAASSIDQGARAGFEGAASGLRDVGHNLFGSQTMIGGLFGGGSEKAAMPSNPAPARPVQQPTAQTTVATPTASPRPLVMSSSPDLTPMSTTGSAPAKMKGSMAAKSRKTRKSKKP